MTWDGRIIGNAAEIPIADESVQCVITSPPYWGLRQYQIQDSIWGGSRECAHEWGPAQRRGGPGGGAGNSSCRPGRSNVEAQRKQDHSLGAWCQTCGAWRGQLGLEPTPDLYVEHIVQVFREVWRVLRQDGTVWLNIGDCYSTAAGPADSDRTRDELRGYRGQRLSNGRGDQLGNARNKTNHSKGRGTPVNQSASSGEADRQYFGPAIQPNRLPVEGLKPKDLAMIPARVALALQADGWWVRSEIIWHKRQPMPESVKDRPTRSHEQIYLLTKSYDYFYDWTAIADPASPDTHDRYKRGRSPENKYSESSRPQTIALTFDHMNKTAPADQHEIKGNGNFYESTKDRVGWVNKRTVWSLASSPYPEAHYATFPPDLVEPCLLAGTPEIGSCATCGTPLQRIIEERSAEGRGSGQTQRKFREEFGGNPDHGAHLGFAVPWNPTSLETIGWEFVCDCPIARPSRAIVLDTFFGSGTVGFVAERFNRLWVGLDLGYQELQKKRLAQLMLDTCY